jgi:hypothetical protein
MTALKKTYLLIGLLCFCSTINAQLIDSIADSFKHKPTLYFNWGSQYSFISNEFANIKWVKAGVDYAGTTKIGIGYNWLAPNPEKIKNIEGIYYNSFLHFNYGSVFIEYSYWKTYRWEASIPVQIGIGKAYYSYVDNYYIKQKTSKSWFILYEPITTITYRFLRYFGAGGGIGYRLVLMDRKDIKETLASPLLVIKTKLFFGDLWHDTKNLFK